MGMTWYLMFLRLSERCLLFTFFEQTGMLMSDTLSCR